MKKQTVSQLAKRALIELEKKHYAEISIIHFKQAFARIERYATKIGETFLSDCLVRKYFLDVYGWDTDSKTIPTAHITSQLRAIRILKYCTGDGCIPGRISNPKKPPNCFRECYERYISECISRGLSEKTITARSDDICNLLVFAKHKGFSSIAEIKRELLDEHLSIRSIQAPGAIPRILSNIRCFLRSMFSNGTIQIDLSLFIPSKSRYPTKSVQKLWTGEEVKDLLGFVDRSDSAGKRNYALMLLILRYGMRAGDVLNLKLADINWDSMTIQFCQEKTTTPNTLPILDDVGWALADWITNARPKQADSLHIFVRLTAPYSGLTDLGSILKKHMVLAGISSADYGKSGPHSLRHALASNMLAEHVPLPVISAVLGHSSSASTMVYLHSNIEGLRQCALDVEEGRQ